LSALFYSLSMDVLHLVIDCQTSHCVWHTLEQAITSLSNSHIMQLHGSFLDIRQGDDSITIYVVTYNSISKHQFIIEFEMNF